MQCKKYDESDLMPVDREGEAHTFEFISDVAGDNDELFAPDGVDNNELAQKLKELGATGPDDVLDPESSCLYAYFKKKEDGVAFLKKLTAYLRQKAHLLKEAKAY